MEQQQTYEFQDRIGGRRIAARVWKTAEPRYRERERENSECLAPRRQDQHTEREEEHAHRTRMEKQLGLIDHCGEMEQSPT
jgi:hypothetical protein